MKLSPFVVDSLSPVI